MFVMVSDKELAERLAKDKVDTVRRRVRATAVLEEVGKHYEEKGLADLTIRRDETGVHAFYRLKSDPSKVVYVEVQPGSDENMILTAVVQDYDESFPLRKPTDGRPTDSVPYDAKALEKLIATHVPQLSLE